ncbi:MAG: glycosyltransferase family 39 protein [Planctomycetes bacterium]|nr:glycosyltransferase family 39 protein [Planctomycetota bacterium]
MTPPWTRRDTLAAAAVAALALAVRLVQASFADVIGTDSSAFLLGAREIALGDWATSLRYGIHPGYPLAILVFGWPLGDLEAGAYAASVLFSSLAVVPVYALARDMASRRVAVVSALLFACLPYFILEHADIMTEGLFHFLFVTSATLAWFSVTRASLRLYLLTAFAAAMAYLTRPEGIYLPAALVGLTGFALAARRVPWKTAAFAAITVALFVMISLPLLLGFRGVTGTWSLTRRGSAETAVAGFTSSQAPPADWGRALTKHAYELNRCTMGVGLALIALGFVFLRGRLRPLGTLYLLCLSLGYSVPPLMASARGYPLSHRYVLVTVLFLLPFAALGCVAATDKLARRWDPRVVHRVAAVVMAAMMLGFIVRAVHPRVDRERTVKEAAEWLRRRGLERATAYSNTSKINWYVGRRVPELPKGAAVELREGEVAVINERRLDEDAPAFRARHRRLASFPEHDQRRVDRISIYAR